MSKFIATIKKIQSVDNLNIVEFEFDGLTLKMMSLELHKEVKLESKVKLLVKPSNVIISKNYIEDISLSNQTLAKIVAIENGELLSSISLEIGDTTFEYIKKYVDEIITVSDYELMESFLILVEKHKLIAENAGILSLAGLRKIKEKDKKIVSVLSGGNIDVLTISSMISKGLISRGRIFSFSVQLPDKPGQLQMVSDILTRLNANVIKLDHN